MRTLWLSFLCCLLLPLASIEAGPLHQRTGTYADIETITYRTVGGTALQLDLLHPIGASNGHLVMRIHGGGWRTGSRATPGVDGLLLALRDAGYTVATIDYRLLPEGHFPNNLSDCRAALKWCQDHAPDYGLDPNAIVVMGESAGGHLAALTATISPDIRWDADPVHPPHAAAVVGLFGIYDFRSDIMTSDRQSPDGVTMVNDMVDESARAEASPANWVDASDPPHLLMVGTEDTLTPQRQTTHYADLLRQAGVPVEVQIIQYAGHGFKPKVGIPTPGPEERRQMVLDFLERELFPVSPSGLP